MSEPVTLTLMLIAALLIKHALADYVLQTPFMYQNKGRYGHPGGVLHAGTHVVFTAPILLLVPPPTSSALAVILAAEFFVHYHIDWAKEQLCRRSELKPDCANFWRLHGLDQLLHGLTYVAIVAALFMMQTPAP